MFPGIPFIVALAAFVSRFACCSRLPDLLEAIAKGDPESVQCLISESITDRVDIVNGEDEDGISPLYASIVIAKNEEITRILLTVGEGANPNQRLMGGTYATHLAVIMDSEFILGLLLQRNADAYAVDSEHNTPAHLAVSLGRRRMVDMLLADRINALRVTEAKDANGRTPLHLAAIQGDAVIVRSLYPHLFFYDMADGFGRTPFHYACASGSVEIADFLMSRRLTRLQLKDAEGNTPLHLAAGSVKGGDAIVVALLDRGVDANPLNEKSETPLDCAYTNGNINAEKIFRRRGAMIGFQVKGVVDRDAKKGKGVKNGVLNKLWVRTRKN